MSEQSRQAFEQFDHVVDNLRRAVEQDTRPKMPKARSLEDFFKNQRDTGDDHVWIAENPGP